MASITHPHACDLASAQPMASQRQMSSPNNDPIHHYAVTLDAPGSPEIQIAEWRDGFVVSVPDGATARRVSVDVFGSKVTELETAPAQVREYALRAVAVILRHKWDLQQQRRGARPDPDAWISQATALGYEQSPHWI